jgi:hypothetical protein
LKFLRAADRWRSELRKGQSCFGMDFTSAWLLAVEIVLEDAVYHLGGARR